MDLTLLSCNGEGEEAKAGPLTSLAQKSATNCAQDDSSFFNINFEDTLICLLL
jgi:hypothetical protein